MNSSFIDLGGHSLKMVFLVNAIKKEFGVKLKLQDIFKGKTISQLSELIEIEIWLETKNNKQDQRKEVVL
ncbi:hypothetical protein THALO_50001 [Tenacibaculum halocynthiae]